ncbi:MAG: LicD family protein [Firmicutes bacterium]|nr:LicD family protein [Bacillota bacterium]
MTELQTKLLELLCEIDDICQKHDIEYVLFAGTALGADRHHGFIPWDDDADIIMTLKNYEKFLKVAPAELKAGRSINCMENDGKDGYFLPYARYVDTETTALQRHTVFGGFKPGIKVDIFCVVPTYADEKKAQDHKEQILAFTETICDYGIMYTTRSHRFHELYEKEQKLLAKSGREKYIAKRSRKLKHKWQIGKPKKYVLYSGIMSNSYVLDARIFDEIKRVPFETTMLPISAHNIDFSRQLYGEGWINLPDNIEKPRHTMLLDFQEPYEKYLKKFREEMDFEEKKSIALERRHAHLIRRKEYLDVALNKQKMTNLIVEMSVTSRFRNANTEDKDWKALHQLFTPYYNEQLNRNNRFYAMMITLEKDIFYCALETAIVVGKHPAALELIHLGLKTGYLKEAEAKPYKDAVSLCVELTNALYLEQKDDAIGKVLQKMDTPVLEASMVAQIAKTWLRIKHETDRDSLLQICNELDSLLAGYGEGTGELHVLKGICFRKMGQEEAADKEFRKGVRCVKNAIVFQKLMDGGYNPYEE